MAITRLQGDILKLLAPSRRQHGESYVAGGVGLNLWLATPRQSRDIDLFHGTEEAIAATWAADRALLSSRGFVLDILREAPSFIEARVTRDHERTIIQWARDSAYRFFPLIEDELMGLALHPFDLATNKVLAMAGRLEARDWIDILNCDERIQPLGYLLWAACGKDPGYNPQSLLAIIARAHYSQAELDALDFEGAHPDARELGQRWHAILHAAGDIVNIIPAEKIGMCAARCNGELFRGTADDLNVALQRDAIRFHAGRIGGAWPSFKS
ncbi:MAG: hypothetical protein WC299_00360 [Kiritimatiellia bacterium]